MSIEFAVTKASGQGEQVTVVVKQVNSVTGEVMYETMADMLDIATQGLTFSDLRMEEMNIRHLEAYQLEKWCDAATWAKILDIIEVLSGRVQASTVAHRWQSALEETEALENSRLQALQNQTYNALAQNPAIYKADGKYPSGQMTTNVDKSQFVEKFHHD